MQNSNDQKVAATLIIEELQAINKSNDKKYYVSREDRQRTSMLLTKLQDVLAYAANAMPEQTCLASSSHQDRIDDLRRSGAV